MKLAIVVPAVLLLGVGGWYWRGAPDAAAGATNANELFTVRRDDLQISITENGTLVAKDSQKITPKLRSEGKITWLVEEGKQVAEGDVVCKLDPAQLEQQIEQLNLEILQTEASLKTARTELEIQEVENVSALAKAEVALDRAKKEQEKYVLGEAPQQKKKLEVAIKDAETNYNRAKKNFEDSQLLLKQNFIKKSELEDHQIEYERTTVQKEGAELEMAIFEKYTFPMQVADLETKVKDAERELQTAQKRGESTLGQKKVAVQQYEKRLKAQQDQLKERTEERDNMTLKAPCPGIVVYGDPHEPWYRQQVKVGGQVWGGQTLMTIPDLRVLQVKIKIHEADIDKVKTGLVANVTMETYPGLVLEGEVSRIASVASGDGYGSRDVKKFDVEVTIQKGLGEQRLRPGISAKAEVLVETRPQVLFVPLQCVFAVDAEHFCYVHAATGPQKRKVTIGASNDAFVEIAAGLEEREQVLLYNPLLGDEGQDGGAKDAAGADGQSPSPEAKSKGAAAVEASAKPDKP